MKLVKSSLSFIERLMKKDAGKSEPKTFAEERLAAEKEALEHEQKRLAQASKYTNAPAPELKRSFNPTASDQNSIVNDAEKFLRNHINVLFGKHTANKNNKKKIASNSGGYNIEVDEFLAKKAHKDIIDNSDITDEAFMAFAAEFVLPGLNKSKTAKFIVSYNGGNDVPFKVEEKFYDSSENEYILNSTNLENFLKNAESEDKNMAKTETPIVYHNAEFNAYESVVTAEPSDKVVARLISAGYKVDPKTWIDTCHGPEFGRLCYRVSVPLGSIPEFKKLAAMTDDEWVNRASEGQRMAPATPSDKAWVDRALDSSHKDNTMRKNDTWVDRTSDPDGHGTPKNPYNTEMKQLFASKSEEAKKENVDAAKKGLEAKADAAVDVAKSIKDLEDLIK